MEMEILLLLLGAYTVYDYGRNFHIKGGRINDRFEFDLIFHGFSKTSFTGIMVEKLKGVEKGTFYKIKSNVFNGKLHGVHTYYDEQGNKEKECVYEYGKLVSPEPPFFEPLLVYHLPR